MTNTEVIMIAPDEVTSDAIVIEHAEVEQVVDVPASAISEAYNEQAVNSLSQIDLIQISPRLLPEDWKKLQDHINNLKYIKDLKQFNAMGKTSLTIEINEFQIDAKTNNNVIVFVSNKPTVLYNDVLLYFVHFIKADHVISIFCRSSIITTTRAARDGYAIICDRIREAIKAREKAQQDLKDAEKVEEASEAVEEAPEAVEEAPSIITEAEADSESTSLSAEQSDATEYLSDSSKSPSSNNSGAVTNSDTATAE